MGLTLLQLIYANVFLSPYSLLENNKGNRETVRGMAMKVS